MYVAISNLQVYCFTCHVQASAYGEVSVHRGEAVEVLDESGGTRWQVRNKFGATGLIPAQLLEVIHKKKSRGMSAFTTAVF